MLERLDEEIRRRTRAAGSFPDAESAIMLNELKMQCAHKYWQDLKLSSKMFIEEELKIQHMNEW